MKIVAILVAGMILSACGLKADLYLPAPTQAPTQSVQEIEASPETASQDSAP